METNTTFDYQEEHTKKIRNGSISAQQEKPATNIKRLVFEYLEDARVYHPSIYREAIKIGTGVLKKYR